jgi:hypothetical protein
VVAAADSSIVPSSATSLTTIRRILQCLGHRLLHMSLCLPWYDVTQMDEKSAASITASASTTTFTQAATPTASAIATIETTMAATTGVNAIHPTILRIT